MLSPKGASPRGKLPKSEMPITLPLYSSGPPESPALDSPSVSVDLPVSLVGVQYGAIGVSGRFADRKPSPTEVKTPAPTLVPPRLVPPVPATDPPGEPPNPQPAIVTGALLVIASPLRSR